LLGEGIDGLEFFISGLCCVDAKIPKSKQLSRTTPSPQVTKGQMYTAPLTSSKASDFLIEFYSISNLMRLFLTFSTILTYF